ncbi:MULTISPECIES: ATP-binding protein [unclassified Leptolyngbya]|uniref:ATP-binding response regulator n=1 Tax=unclassified Leptolyngbya TaxID=2650499 RepID=UPI0016869B00|nr:MULTISPECIES: ATP-binding protein [unclassified Leptolyngbya]MBD1912967.1 response regulator [Leptolyngbya sp. FACHB-8]MBD2155722.1 response regulator [Leptolyngbya sp. FACHB-16]
MPDSDDAIFCQMLPVKTFEQLRELLRRMAQRMGAQAIFLTEEIFISSRTPLLSNAESFGLVISPAFSALLTARPIGSAESNGHASGVEADTYAVALSFEPGAISAFLDYVIQKLQSRSTLVETLEKFLPVPRLNDPQVQSEFTLQLARLLAPAPVTTGSVSLNGAQPQRDTLEQQVIERTQDLHDAMLAAETASRAKSEFIAAISHELRTPLTAIIGMSATLLRWSLGELNDRQRGFIQTIYDSGQHLLELINDILDLSQLEAGNTVLKLSAFSLTLLSQQTLKIMQDVADQRGVNLELDSRVDGGRDRFIADPYRVQQILLNLLSNAIKFTPDGGHVTLRVFADENSAILQVKDTGIGIPEEKRSLLFQKFQQLDTSYHRVYQGTGLGLALTKQLVELHGGRITVDSTVGVGTVFTIQLPARADVHGSIPESPLGLATDSGQKRIVLVENHEESANILCDMLTTAGYQLVWILESSTALNQIEVLQPDAVITGVDEPNIDGFELIRHLRQNPTTKHLKVLAIVAPNAQDSQARSLQVGADDCLIRPIQPTQVLPKIMLLTSRLSTSVSEASK